MIPKYSLHLFYSLYTRMEESGDDVMDFYEMGLDERILKVT